MHTCTHSIVSQDEIGYLRNSEHDKFMKLKQALHDIIMNIVNT